MSRPSGNGNALRFASGVIITFWRLHMRYRLQYVMLLYKKHPISARTKKIKTQKNIPTQSQKRNLIYHYVRFDTFFNLFSKKLCWFICAKRLGWKHVLKELFFCIGGTSKKRENRNKIEHNSPRDLKLGSYPLPHTSLSVLSFKF